MTVALHAPEMLVGGMCMQLLDWIVLSHHMIQHLFFDAGSITFDIYSLKLFWLSIFKHFFYFNLEF